MVIVNYRLFFGFFECLGVYFLCLFIYLFFTSTHKLTFLSECSLSCFLYQFRIVITKQGYKYPRDYLILAWLKQKRKQNVKTKITDS